MTSKKVDWDKVRRARLDGVVVGGLSKSKKPQILEVSFLTPDAQRAYRTRVTIVNGRISSTQLVEIRDGVAAAVRAARAPAAPVAAVPPPSPPPAPGAVAKPPPAGVTPPPPGEIAPPPPGGDRPAARGDGDRPPGGRRDRRVGGRREARPGDGGDGRPARAPELELHAGQLAPGVLRTYGLSLFTEPRALIGLYPVRSAEGILFAAAGLELSGAVAIGPVLAGSDPSAPKFPLSLWWLDGGRAGLAPAGQLAARARGRVPQVAPVRPAELPGAPAGRRPHHRCERVAARARRRRPHRRRIWAAPPSCRTSSSSRPGSTPPSSRVRAPAPRSRAGWRSPGRCLARCDCSWAERSPGRATTSTAPGAQ